MGVTLVPSGCRHTAWLLPAEPLLDLYRGAGRRRRAGSRAGIGPVPVGVAADLVAGAAGGGEDEFGGGVDRKSTRLGQHARVRVGGDDDAGVAEQILQGLQVGARLVGQRRGPMAELMEPDRWDVDLAEQ